MLCEILLLLGLGFSQGRLLDLTHPIDQDFVYWPGQIGLVVKTTHKGNTSDLSWLEYAWVGMPEHSGTHLDAPAFLVEGHWKVAGIPPHRLLGPGVVLDVRSQAARNSAYQVTVEDVQSWEKDHGRIPEGAIILVNSGWGPRFPNMTLVFGTANLSDSSAYRFPSLHPDTMQWLVDNRRIDFIGIDTPSLDVAPSTTYPAHQIAFAANIPVLEAVANLESMPASGATVIIAPLNLKDGAGAPTRVLAILVDPPSAAAVHLPLGKVWFGLVFVVVGVVIW